MSFQRSKTYLMILVMTFLRRKGMHKNLLNNNLLQNYLLNNQSFVFRAVC